MNSKTFDYYHQSFTEWLKAVGYSPSSVYGFPRTLQEFFLWLTERNITEVKQITGEHTEKFLDYNKTRANKRKEGAISASHMNKYIDVINKFNEYLKNISTLQIPINTMRLEGEPVKPMVILTIEQIELLYKTTDQTPFGQRDRAMLAIYYGCGLRLSEGARLDVSDVLMERKLVFVKEAKNNHQRYVPITAGNLKHVESYIYNTRTLLVGEKSNEQGLFISERGTRISKQQLYLRLKGLCKMVGITREGLGVHTLRHSIATHLLESGMELENIALFLGHRCLDSTQLYTHILNEQ